MLALTGLHGFVLGFISVCAMMILGFNVFLRIPRWFKSKQRAAMRMVVLALAVFLAAMLFMLLFHAGDGLRRLQEV